MYPFSPPRCLTVVSGRWFGFGLALLLSLVAFLNGSQILPSPPAAHHPLELRLGQLPLVFIRNGGQVEAPVQFQAQGLDGTIFFTPEEVVLARSGVQALHLHFEGANSEVQVEGSGQLPGQVNYFTGNDPARWQTNLPTYRQVVYRHLYQGIDLHFDGSVRQLKGTYIIAAGADPTRIRWQYRGAEQIHLDETSGALHLTLYPSTEEPAAGITGLIEAAPVAWQEIEKGRQPVAVRYNFRADGTIGFSLGDYNPAYPLIIDPSLSYTSSYLGGNDFEEANGVTVDGAGNIYVIGSTSSTNFPTKNPLYPNNRGIRDVFIAKFNPAGTALLYATYLGGSNIDIGQDIAVDSAGNAYLTGSVGIGLGNVSDFPTTAGAYDRTGEIVSAFITKLNPSGSQLIYSTYLGGPGLNNGLGIAIDGGGNAYVIGQTRSSQFPTKNAFQPNYGGGITDAFVTKLNSTGSALVYSTYLGGNNWETTLDTRGAGIAVDSNGQAYVTTTTASSNFPTTPGAFDRTLNGPADAFVAKFNASGQNLIYSTFLGGSSASLEHSYDLALDSGGNAYVTGVTTSTDFPLKNPLQGSLAGGGDIFITQLNPGGTGLLYSTYLGGLAGDFGFSLALDPQRNIYVTGSTTSADFPTLGPIQATNQGGIDGIAVKLNGAGTRLLFSTYLGGGLHDQGNGVAATQNGHLVVAGNARSTNFPVKQAVQPIYGGGTADAFVTKIVPGSIPEVYLPLLIR